MTSATQQGSSFKAVLLILGTLMEVKARNGSIIAIAEEEYTEELKGIDDEIVTVPATTDECAPILTSIALQLFAYYMANERGADIDQPRNLAKSVRIKSYLQIRIVSFHMHKLKI